MKSTLTTVFSGFLMLSALPASAALISVTPSAQNTVVGASFQVQLVVSDLGEGVAPSLASYDLDFSYDPIMLNYTGAVFGDPLLGNQLDLLGLGSLNVQTPGVGSVNLYELSFDSPEELNLLQAGTFTLATLFFDALSIGDSELGVTLNSLGDALGDPLAAQVANSNITVAPVPLPSAGLLLVSGFLTWSRFIRKNKLS